MPPSLQLMLRKLTLWAFLSMAGPAIAHEVRPAITDVSVSETTVEIILRAPLEPIIAGMNLAGLEDTNLSPLAGRYDALRAEDPMALEAALRAAWPAIAAKITLVAGETRLTPEIAAVSVPEVGDITQPRDSELRLVATLPGPVRGLIGPWAHSYPHDVTCGPAIGWLQEVLRWCDHWMKGRDTGIMDEPRLRVWMQDSVPPQTCYTTRPGRWVGEPLWPSPRIENLTFYLAPTGLSPTPIPDNLNRM